MGQVEITLEIKKVMFGVFCTWTFFSLFKITELEVIDFSYC